MPMPIEIDRVPKEGPITLNTFIFTKNNRFYRVWSYEPNDNVIFCLPASICSPYGTYPREYLTWTDPIKVRRDSIVCTFDQMLSAVDMVFAYPPDQTIGDRQYRKRQLYARIADGLRVAVYFEGSYVIIGRKPLGLLKKGDLLLTFSNTSLDLVTFTTLSGEFPHTVLNTTDQPGLNPRETFYVIDIVDVNVLDPYLGIDLMPGSDEADYLHNNILM